MRRRLLIALAVFGALVVAGAILVRLLIDPERLKETALAQAREATGYAMEAGPASVRLGWSGAGVGVESFRMASPDSSQTLTVARTDVYLKLLPLLRRQLELRELVLHRPRLNLRVHRRPSAAPGGPDAAPGAGGSPALAIFAVESWKVEDGFVRGEVRDGGWELGGVNLAGGFRWTPREGGEGTAEGRADTGRWSGAAGTWDLPALTAKARFSMNAAGDSLRLPEVELAAAGLRLALAGGYVQSGPSWSGALEGRADPVTWDQLRPYLPAAAETALADKELAGRFTLERLRLELTPEGENRASGVVRVQEAAARLAGAPLGLTDGRALVVFEPGRVAMEGGEGRLGDEPITFDGRLDGDPPQRFQARVATSLAGPVLSGLLPAAARVDLRSGALAVDLSLAGGLPLDAGHLPRVDGRVDLRDLAGTLRDIPLHEARGSVLLREGGAAVNDLALRWGASDLLLNGVVADLADPKLRFTLTGNLVDLDEAWPPEPAAPEDGAESGPPAQGEPAPVVGIPATGWIEIGRLRVRGQELGDVRVHADLGLEGLFLEQATALVQQGTLAGRMQVVPGAVSGTWRYEGEATLAGVAAGPVLAVWLPAEGRVEGRADADITWEGTTAPGVDPRAALTVEGDLSLRDGAFVNLPAIRSVAEALQVREGMGERWSFRDLWARFAVRQGRLVVDTLQVVQRGLDWHLAGSLGLAGDLDLTGTLRADPQVVFIPPELRLFAAYLAEADGRIPVDFRIGGTFDDPLVSLNWSELAARAAAKARGQGDESLPENLDRLKKLLGGKKKSSGG